jgi:hypothetical protein
MEHMSPNQDWFISYHLLPVHKNVRLGDGFIIYAIAIGHVCKGNLTNLRRELHLSLAKGNPK